MKLITAIKLIEEREKNKRKAEKENKKNGSFMKNNPGNSHNELRGDDGTKHLVHVQSIFPQDDIIALKMKTREGHIREAISKAVYYYLKCGNENRT